MATVLKPEHYAAIQYLSLPRTERPTMEDIATELGVSRMTLYRWTQLPEFQAELRDANKARALRAMPDVIESMVKSATQHGSAQAAKALMAAADMFTNHVEVTTPTTPTVPTSIDEIRERIARYGNKQQVEDAK